MVDLRDIIAQQDEQGIAHGALVDDAAKSFGDGREFFSIADKVTRNQAASNRSASCFDIVGAVGIIVGQVCGVLSRLVRTEGDIEARKGIVEGCQRSLHVATLASGSVAISSEKPLRRTHAKLRKLGIAFNAATCFNQASTVFQYT
jgi:hypothetical protein